MSKELFEKYGISDEITAENIDEVQGKLETAILDKHLNDPKFYEGLDATKLPDTLFKTKYEEAKKGEINETIKLIGKQYGLSKEETGQFSAEELSDRGKYLAKAYSILMSRDNSKEQVQKLQIDFATREEEYTKQINDLTTSLQNKDTEATAKVEAFRTDMAVMSVNQKIEKNIIVKPHVGLQIALPILKNEYAVVLENNMPVLRNKENPNLKVLIEGTSKEKSVEMRLAEIYKEQELWKDDNAGQAQSQQGSSTFTPGQQTEFSAEELKQIEQEKALYGDK